jgi:hypothetical protein
MTRFERLIRSAVAGIAMLGAACGGSDLVLPGGAGPAAIEPVAGDAQSGRAGAPLPDSLVVRVTDATGRPVQNQPVAFTDAGGGGALSPDTTKTDSGGRAESRWVLGSAVGMQRAQAAVVGADGPLAVAFTATATVGSANRLVQVSGDLQSATAGSALPESLVVRAVDGSGNGVAGVRVSWSVSGGGSISPTAVNTGADGRAAALRVLGSTPGTQTASAAASGLSGSPVVFTQLALAAGGGGGGGGGGGANTHLVFATQPSDATEGATIKPAVRVAVVDQQGGLVTSVSGTVTLDLSGGKKAKLGGDRSRSLSGGVATFDDLTVNRTGTYTLVAQLDGIGSVESAPFRITQ